MGAQLSPVGGLVAEVDVAVADVDNQVVIAVAAGLGQLAVQVQHMGRAGLLMQVVDVLGDDADIVFLFQPHQLAVPLVGFDLEKLPAPLVVEVKHQLGVAQVGVVGGHVLYTVVLPEAVAVAEGADATLGTDAGTGEYDYFFHGIYVEMFNC